MGDQHRKARQRGKQFERDVANALGTRRVLKTGTMVPDIEHPVWRIDCKCRDTLSPFKAITEAEEKYGSPACIVWKRKGMNVDNSLVFFRFKDVKEWMSDEEAG